MSATLKLYSGYRGGIRCLLGKAPPATTRPAQRTFFYTIFKGQSTHNSLKQCNVAFLKLCVQLYIYMSEPKLQFCVIINISEFEPQ